MTKYIRVLCDICSATIFDHVEKQGFQDPVVENLRKRMASLLQFVRGTPSGDDAKKELTNFLDTQVNDMCNDCQESIVRHVTIATLEAIEKRKNR